MKLIDRLRAADKDSVQRANGSRIFADAANEIERLREALILARAAHVLRAWDEETLAVVDAALTPNAQLQGPGGSLPGPAASES